MNQVVKTYIQDKAVATGHETPEQELARLRQEIESFKARAQAKLKLKVSEKGGLSLYGMGRFPVTLYKSQWEQVFANQAMIQDFIKSNGATLKEKA